MCTHFFELLRSDNAQNTLLRETLDIVRTPEKFAHAFLIASAEPTDSDSDDLWALLSDPDALRNPMALAARLRTEISVRNLAASAIGFRRASGSLSSAHRSSESESVGSADAIKKACANFSGVRTMSSVSRNRVF